MCLTPDQRQSAQVFFSLPTLTTFLSGCSRSSDGFSTTSITKINRRLFYQLLPFDITKWKTLGAIYVTTATLILSTIKIVFPPPSLLPLSWRTKKSGKNVIKKLRISITDQYKFRGNYVWKLTHFRMVFFKSAKIFF